MEAVSYAGVRQMSVSEHPKPKVKNPTQVLENVLRVVNPCGAVGLIGVYVAPDPGGKNAEAKKGIFPFPLADFFDKAVTLGSGQVLVKRYTEHLRDLIVNGRAKPSKIVRHHIDIDEARDALR